MGRIDVHHEELFTKKNFTVSDTTNMPRRGGLRYRRRDIRMPIFTFFSDVKPRGVTGQTERKRAFEKQSQTGPTPVDEFVYLCQTCLISLTGVRFPQDCPERLRRVRMVDVGTLSIPTNKNENRRRARRIRLASRQLSLFQLRICRCNAFITLSLVQMSH